MKVFLRKVLFLFLFSFPIFTGINAQDSRIESQLKQNAATRIYNQHGISLNWENSSLLEIMGVESRVKAVERIKTTHGYNFDWEKWTLQELMDIEARLNTAKRIKKRSGKVLNWKRYSLEELISIENDLNPPANNIRNRRTSSGVADSRRSVGTGYNIAVIAPSISTSWEARDIMRRKRWFESSLKDADSILVVVRSGLLFPLFHSYDSVGELREDAEGQLNITGNNFHVYLFDINSDLSVSEINHQSYAAED
jgi:hypothetical protein